VRTARDVEPQPVRIAVVDKSDHPTAASIAALVVAAAARGEALGLSPTITVDQYLDRLAPVLADAALGNATVLAAIAPDGTVIGTAQWARSSYPTRRFLAELDRVVVAPAARGLGVGQALLDAIVADARAADIEVLMLEARGNNHGALALYERNGFQRSGVLPNVVAIGAARHDMVLMCRDLGRPAGLDALGDLPAGNGASLPSGVSQGRDWQRTERLLLCVPTPQVADAYFTIHGDPATNVYNPSGPMLDPAAVPPILEIWQQHWREDGYGYWVVRDPGDGHILGFGGVRPPLQGDEVFLNLYYRFRPEAWGNGYATEVGRAALALAAKMAPGIPVVALIRPKNEPSIRVAERLGLRLEGEVQRQLGMYLKYSAIPEL
jgi:RimJ/RimL family protein N-acetyltransferase